MLDRYEMPKDELLLALIKTGWIAFSTPTEARKKLGNGGIEKAVRAYQDFHGLEVDGWAGPQTERSLEEFRFCGLPDRMDVQLELAQWPMKAITWAISGLLPAVSPADQKDAYALAWNQWADVCGIVPSYSTNPKTANVVMGSGPIDRAGSTLAWSELPGGAVKQLAQKYDTLESWVIAENPGRNQIDLVRVACHEIGHALGLPHIAAGNLLQPTYDLRIRKPQAGDIAEVVRRYGRPAAPPPPGPPPPDGGGAPRP